MATTHLGAQNPPGNSPVFPVEPVEGFGPRDEVDAGILERSGLGRAFDTREAVVGGEIFSPAWRIFGVWLDAVNAISVLQKKLTQEPVRSRCRRYVARAKVHPCEHIRSSQG